MTNFDEEEKRRMKLNIKRLKLVVFEGFGETDPAKLRNGLKYEVVLIFLLNCVFSSYWHWRPIHTIRFASEAIYAPWLRDTTTLICGVLTFFSADPCSVRIALQWIGGVYCLLYGAHHLQEDKQNKLLSSISTPVTFLIIAYLTYIKNISFRLHYSR